VEAPAVLNPAVAAVRNLATRAALNPEVASPEAEAASRGAEVEAVAPTHATEALAPIQAPARRTLPATRVLLAPGTRAPLAPATRVLRDPPVIRVLRALPVPPDRPAVQPPLRNNKDQIAIWQKRRFSSRRFSLRTAYSCCELASGSLRKPTAFIARLISSFFMKSFHTIPVRMFSDISIMIPRSIAITSPQYQSELG
jgi:hypothetical protein